MARPVRKEWTPSSEFQRWLDTALARRGIDLKTLAVTCEIDYSNLWRVARGAPSKYPSRNRPSYENTVLIGRALGDEAGALRAARYDTDDEVSEVAPPEIERVTDPDRDFVVHAYEGLPTMDKKRLREFAELLKRANQAASIGGGGETEGDGE